MQRRIFLLVLASISLCAFRMELPPPKPPIPQIILIGDVLQIIKDDPGYIILDIRTPWEFNAGHLPGAININWYAFNFREEISKLDSEKPIIVYCHSGVRSEKSMQAFIDAGFTDIYEMKEGYSAWQAAGFVVEK